MTDKGNLPKKATPGGGEFPVTKGASAEAGQGCVGVHTSHEGGTACFLRSPCNRKAPCSGFLRRCLLHVVCYGFCVTCHLPQQPPPRQLCSSIPQLQGPGGTQ